MRSLSRCCAAFSLWCLYYWAAACMRNACGLKGLHPMESRPKQAYVSSSCS